MITVLHLPRVIPVFSSKVFGCALREISTKGGSTAGMKRFIAGPITIAISPIAQQALLHTEINSDFVALIWILNLTWIEIQGQHGNELIDMGLDELETSLGKITQQCKCRLPNLEIDYAQSYNSHTSGNPSRIHWAISISRFEFWTKGSIILPKPSAKKI